MMDYVALALFIFGLFTTLMSARQEHWSVISFIAIMWVVNALLLQIKVILLQKMYGDI